MLPLSLHATAVAVLFGITVSATAASASIATPIRAAMSSPLHLVHEGHSGAAQASGTVNAVDAIDAAVSLIGWPAIGCRA